MIKMRIKKNEKAEDGKVFNIDIDPAKAFDTISDIEGAEVANKCTMYAYRVYLQKDIAEAGGGDTGRDWELVAKHLDAKGVSYTVTDWVKGAKTVDPRLAMLEGLSVEEIAEAVRIAKAGK